MNTELSSQMFEWLLADWAGYREDPEKVFPSLKGENLQQISGELDIVIHQACYPHVALEKLVSG